VPYLSDAKGRKAGHWGARQGSLQFQPGRGSDLVDPWFGPATRYALWSYLVSFAIASFLKANEASSSSSSSLSLPLWQPYLYCPTLDSPPGIPGCCTPFKGKNIDQRYSIPSLLYSNTIVSGKCDYLGLCVFCSRSTRPSPPLALLRRGPQYDLIGREDGVVGATSSRRIWRRVS